MSSHKRPHPDLDPASTLPKRPRTAAGPLWTPTSTHVAQHYNARPEVGREKRKQSPIYSLKNFNNWVKSVLISKYVRRGDRVLDMCCGKGGDLQKWRNAGIAEVLGVDIADVSVDQARQRFREGNFRFKAEYHAADCFTERLADQIVPPDTLFDLVSIQFALHYSFESEEKARRALENITANLRPGGHLIATVPNCYWLVKKLRHDGLVFGNSILTVKFDSEKASRYGHKYNFELKDAIDDCPEYVFHFPTFEKLAAEYGLKLLYKKPFHQLYREESEIDAHLQLMQRMNVVNDEGTVSADEWEVTGLYVACAFEKVE
ncbi:guanine-N(7)-methyltransferase domain-containing protein [Blyttiomyces helicus]|uniref:mRNA cap guanine-N(7) methyltransferase n=1 Tax=Blyttiomyces helicus TaxID=388810 RepID=A0A4P9VYE7_9FUNG|nr:guanine-N(7)-methyltransferase domain-containing protein [Blyttiomyces helicus]|eukprot:RKO82806.1 guanine-N(7)-methyltransferase domain-containing protein [Blyttiomyces helicus]